jgi:hypothetical protein
MCEAVDYTTWAGEPFPDTDSEVFIQWKGTEVCIDFRCPCGFLGHFDGGFAYSVECSACGATYDLGTQVRVRRVDEPFGEPQPLT